MKLFFAVAVLFFCVPVAAQTLPDAPTPHLERAEWLLLANVAGARAFDTWSTRRSLDYGNREKFLPGALVDHTAALSAFEAGFVAVDYYAARGLIRRRHRKLARLLLLADAAQVWPWVIRNLTMPRNNR